MEWIFVWCVASLGVGLAATPRGRGSGTWFLIALVISPLLAILLLLLLPTAEDVAKSRAQATGEAGDFRKCPQCAEVVRREAVVCRFCHADLVPPRQKTLLERRRDGDA